jgi:hypothetical protein
MPKIKTTGGKLTPVIMTPKILKVKAMPDTPAGTDVQMVKIPKDKYPSEEEAKALCEQHGYKTDDPSHDDAHWGYAQFPKEELVGESTEGELKDGMIGVMGARKTDASYEQAGDGTTGLQDEGSIDGEDIDLETEEPQKAGDVWQQQALDLLQALNDHFNSTEATQERQDILDAWPALADACQAMQDEISGMGATEEKKGKKDDENAADNKPESDYPYEDDEKAKRFRVTWAAGKAFGTIQEYASAAMVLFKALYNSPTITTAQKNEIRKTYHGIKGALSPIAATAPAKPVIDSEAILKAMAARDEKFKAFDDRFASLTGAMP